MAYTKGEVSKLNKIKRKICGKTLDILRQRIVFTDKHMLIRRLWRPVESCVHFERAGSQRYSGENQRKWWLNTHWMMGQLIRKCKKLEFYHDDEDYTERPKRLRKPRRLDIDTNEKKQKKIMAWEASYHMAEKPKLRATL